MGRLSIIHRRRASEPSLLQSERAETVKDLIRYSNAFTMGPEGFLLAGYIPYMIPAPLAGLSLASTAACIIHGVGIHLLIAVITLAAAFAVTACLTDGSTPDERGRAAWYLLGMDDAGLLSLKAEYLPQEQ